MVLVYLGGVESLTQEVAEVQEALDRRYTEILGETRVQRLREVTRRVLSPESFFHDRATYEATVPGTMPEGSSNKLIFMGSSHGSITPQGKITDRKVRTSVAFYIAEEAFNHSGSSDFTERQVASYVHEFNHFVWYALQRVPIYVCNTYLEHAKDFPQHGGESVVSYQARMQDAGVSPTRQTKNITLALFGHTVTDNFEKANRILDRMVLTSIGIDVPLDWRYRHHTMYPLPLPTGVMFFGRGGDPFRKFSDAEAVERFLQWDHYTPGVFGSSYLSFLMASLRDLKVSRVPLSELLCSS